MDKEKELLQEMSITTTNLISFETLSQRKIEEECPHLNIGINKSLTTVTCTDCEKEISPMWVLCTYAEHQKSVYNELRKQLSRVKNIEKMLEKKQRTKCTHCGRFTPVNISMSDSKWMGLDVVK